MHKRYLYFFRKCGSFYATRLVIVIVAVSILSGCEAPAQQNTISSSQSSDTTTTDSSAAANVKSEQGVKAIVKTSNASLNDSKSDMKLKNSHQIFMCISL